MDVGLIIPQGFTGEYEGWTPARAWQRSLDVARWADGAGIESIWLFDHFYPEDREEGLMFEGFTSLAALAVLTEHVRLGHLVACAAYRNPALTAKMIGTIDVLSGGRVELGLGAGWYRAEHEAYGYRFPSLRERQVRLAESLEIARRMLGPGRATFEGSLARVTDAVNDPRGLQEPRVPIIVGGNGQAVTWRLAARHADELNLDGPTPADVRAWLPIIAARCEEIGREPADLRVSVFLWWGNTPAPGTARSDWLAAYRDLGIERVMAWVPDAAAHDEALEAFRADMQAAGVGPERA